MNELERDMLDFAYWSYVAAHAAPEARAPAENLARASLTAAAEARRAGSVDRSVDRPRAYSDAPGSVGMSASSSAAVCSQPSTATQGTPSASTG